MFKHTSIFLSLLAILFAIAVYFSGIDGRQIPKNGDENVYLHITRLTAAEHHWLPLESNLDHMRNTKPPLLFWQGIAASRWGVNWQLDDIRTPNVIYTLLTGLLAGLLTLRIARSRGDAKAWTRGLMAGLIWLAFWSTFKYGRPFLTSSVETFWFFAPLVLLLGFRQWFESRFLFPLLLGVLWGLGLLTKSFSLLIPAGIGMAAIFLLHRTVSPPPLKGEREGRVTFLKQDLFKLVVAGLIALAIFSLWFIVDPHPHAVWQEFVIGENLGKFDRSAGLLTYFHKFFWGSGSVWVYLLSGISNAGLLMLPMLGLIVYLIRARKHLRFEQVALCVWILVWLAFFAIPSQRSARYLIPVMPAVAVLLALSWEQLKPWLFKVSHALGLITAVVLVMLEILLLQHLPESHMLLIAISSMVFVVMVIASVMGIGSSRYTRNLLPMTSLAVFGLLSCLLVPINESHFTVSAPNVLQGQRIAVPCNFRATDEMYQFDLPKSHMTGYRVEDQNLADLTAHERFFVWQGGLDDPAPHCQHCKVLSHRIELLSRQSPAQVHAMLRGDIVANLIAREWLIQSTRSTLEAPLENVCR